MGLLDWLIGAAIVAIAGAIVAGVVITVIELTLDDVLDWFGQRKSMLANDSELTAITALVQDASNNGNIRVVQGVFNKSQQEWVESRTIDAESLDSSLAAKHWGRQVVEYAPYEY